MVFSGILFLYYFLPCVLLGYFVVPQKYRNGILLIASLIFYAWGEPIYVLLMIFSILLGYVFGILLEKNKTGQALAGVVCLFTVVFIFFKYTDFFIVNWNAVMGTSCPLLHLALPIGISFYTFQIISYLVDVYRGEVPAQKNLISLALYVSMFPQLIAGPIVRYKTVAEQIEKRNSTWQLTESGITRFIIGLSKKVLLANELGALCEIFRASDEKSVLFYWIYAIAFCLHIYFDFSGYSDMAIGLGRIFGFTFMENFHYPYISKSITEFWRRWHISLGTWFRDYVYIPLGGSRVPKWKWYRNIFIVWLFTGFWHGAAWNFILWGLYFGGLLVIEKNWLSDKLEKIGIWSHVYTLLLVMLGFVIFNATSLGQAFEDIKCLIGMGGLPTTTTETIYYLRSYGITLLIAVLGSTPWMEYFFGKISYKNQGMYDTYHQIRESALGIIKTAVLLGLLILCTAYLADGSFNPFLYFRF